jgi:hypothetical protein
MRYKYTKQELEKIISESLSLKEVFSKMNIVAAGGNYKTIKDKLKKWNIDISHFTGSAWNVGTRYTPFGKKSEIKDILVNESNYTNSSFLRKRLIKEGLKEEICECCKLKEWMHQPIKLELHHKNGVNNDNRLENLELLCPNCHSYTDNYRGKNIKSSVGTDIQV